MDTNNNSEPMLLSVQEVATKLGVTKKVVNGLIDSGELVAKTSFDKTYVLSSSVAAMLGNETVNSGKIDNGLLNDTTLYLSDSDESDAGEVVSVVVNGKVYKGKVYEQSDGRFLVSIPKGKKPDGSRDREQVFFRDKGEAEDYLAKRLVDLNGGAAETTNSYPNSDGMLYDMFIKNSNIYKMKENFEEYAMRILNRGVGRAGKRTIECYRTGLVPVVKRIGHMRIADITKDHLIELFNDLSYDYSDSSLSKSFLGTRWIFNEAYDNEPFLKNPFDKLKCPASEKPQGEEREPYTDEELQDLFIKAKKYGNKIVYPMLTIYECTGMRPAELRALEWKNYDRDSKTLYVRNAVITVYDKITDMRKKPKAHEQLSKPKSKYGVRPLLLSDIAVAALDEWRKELDTMPEKMKNSNFIFPSKDGGFKSETSVKTIMQRFVAKCGLEDVGFMQYRFRHTVCTRLLTAGLSVPVVQRILGDNTPNVIYNVYYHLSNKKLFEVYAEYFKNQDLRYIDIYKNNYEEADGESVS